MNKLIKLGTFFIVIIGIAVLGAFFAISSMVTPDNLDEGLVPDAASQFYDLNGNVIYTTSSEERRLPIAFEQMPKHLREAFIAIEDNRFYEHAGIDYRGTFRAFVSNVTGGEVQGGSTITQQLAKNAFLTQERTIVRKIKEAFIAKELESKYSKDEILALYLNQIYFGQGAYGVESAAQYYFGKSAKNLNLAEDAVLAAIPKSPNYYNPFENPKESKARQEIVLDQMAKYGYITEEECVAAKTQKLTFRTFTTDKDSRNYFFDYVTQRVIEQFGADALYKGGLKVYTTLDSAMQKDAENSLGSLPTYYTDDEKRVQPQVALVAVEPQTGYIRAMIGGRGDDKFNRAALAVRQPGSSFKGFVYLTGMDNGLTAGDVVEDKKYNFGGGWNPQNYDRKYHGKVTLRTALKKSYNIPSILVSNQVTHKKVVEMAKALGISTLVEDGEYTDENPAMALGGLTNGVTPLEMASAYGVIANNGVRNLPTAIVKIVDRDNKTLYEYKPDNKSVVSAKAAYQTTDMLKDVLTSGTAAVTNIGRPAAGKTGTTDTYKDAWFVGYSANLSCAVWVGDDNGVPTQGIAGSGTPLTIWEKFMVNAAPKMPYADFVRPPDAVTPQGEILPDGTHDDPDKEKDGTGGDKPGDATTETGAGNLATPPKVTRPKDVKKGDTKSTPTETPKPVTPPKKTTPAVPAKPAQPNTSTSTNTTNKNTNTSTSTNKNTDTGNKPVISNKPVNP